MTPEQKRLVQETWALVRPIADQAAQMFYQRLFELDPSLKVLFRNDMDEQGKKLMQMLGTCVAGLDKLDELMPAVVALGRRHTDYKVHEEDYLTVGEALLWTLQQGLGDKFTEDVKEAWTEVYVTLSTVMKTAASSPAA